MEVRKARRTYTNPVPVRLLSLPEVDPQTRAALGTKELILLLGVELVGAAPLAAVVVPHYVLGFRVYFLPVGKNCVSFCWMFCRGVCDRV